ncbi:hypothetical protein AQ475_01200 [Burkholderia thailandensis]|nr:hypothetical protein AQ475_01200 [Burkholderia thailandensis]
MKFDEDRRRFARGARRYARRSAPRTAHCVSIAIAKHASCRRVRHRRKAERRHERCVDARRDCIRPASDSNAMCAIANGLRRTLANGTTHPAENNF